METTPSLWALSLFFLIIVIFSLPSYQLCALHQVRYKLSELSVTPLTHVYIRAHVGEHTYRHTHILLTKQIDLVFHSVRHICVSRLWLLLLWVIGNRVTTPLIAGRPLLLFRPPTLFGPPLWPIRSPKRHLPVLPQESDV